jgi:hypothetical protein
MATRTTNRQATDIGVSAPADFWRALLVLVFDLLVVHTDSMIQPRPFVFKPVIPGINWVVPDSRVSFVLVRDQFPPAGLVSSVLEWVVVVGPLEVE